MDLEDHQYGTAAMETRDNIKTIYGGMLMNKEIKKAIENLKWVMEEPNHRILSDESKKIIYPLAITALEAQQADRWIPISSGKLPDRELNQPKRVLITTSSGYVYEAGYIGNNIFCMEGNPIDVIAWQDMPERWKEEQ